MTWELLSIWLITTQSSRYGAMNIVIWMYYTIRIQHRPQASNKVIVQVVYLTKLLQHGCYRVLVC
ncbi:hypothetical protein D3C75_1048660 [compost metagenome]